MLKKILSISGKKGLFRLVKQGRNMIIVESLVDGKRTPAYGTDKIISLGDISMYTTEEDVPLSKVLTLLKDKAEGKPVDVDSLDDAAVRSYFATVLPDFDDERVYTSDIRKLLNWYNQLLAAGITDYAEEEAPKTEE
ncbi:MAG: DUF5606 domain-containing protein [Muribaculaceae bacterium]|nr:DUF5606 domain-containing protein [Muribaculaceae bacterium]